MGVSVYDACGCGWVVGGWFGDVGVSLYGGVGCLGLALACFGVFWGCSVFGGLVCVGCFLWCDWFGGSVRSLGFVLRVGFLPPVWYFSGLLAPVLGVLYSWSRGWLV